MYLKHKKKTILLPIKIKYCYNQFYEISEVFPLNFTDISAAIHTTKKIPIDIFMKMFFSNDL